MSEPIPGDWTLNFALPYRGGSVLPNPAPGKLGLVTATFETVAASCHSNGDRTEWDVVYRSAGPGTYRFVVT